MRILLVCLCSLLISFPVLGQTFDIQAFSDSTKYGWKDYNDRNQYLQDLSHRQSLLQIYELEAQPLNANIVKSTLIPGWGQFSTKANTKGTVILGAELVLIGTSLFFMDRAMDNYRLYKKATQVEDIESYYKDAQVPYQYSFILMGFAGIVWVYNVFDVIQSTQAYNANLWKEVLERSRNNPLQITPNGLELRF
ncbi:MAG TPA: hypothetical protein PL160_00345 [Candidatus Cloacimonas sp.]|nr:hypothetical protein [Candidatus Cloacimonas sp.]